MLLNFSSLWKTTTIKQKLTNDIDIRIWSTVNQFVNRYEVISKFGCFPIIGDSFNQGITVQSEFVIMSCFVELLVSRLHWATSYKVDSLGFHHIKELVHLIVESRYSDFSRTVRNLMKGRTISSNSSKCFKITAIF